VAWIGERCGDCTAAKRCRWHAECVAHLDARTASDIGVGWARFVWHAIDIRRPWPACTGRCADIATRLVAWLSDDDARRKQLAEVCSWRAGLQWEALQAGSRDRPYREPSGEGTAYALPGREHVVIRFRPRAAIVLARAALEHRQRRAAQFRAAHGLVDEPDGERAQPGVRRRRW
jgi:hypothetical protein